MANTILAAVLYIVVKILQVSRAIEQTLSKQLVSYEVWRTLRCTLLVGDDSVLISRTFLSALADLVVYEVPIRASRNTFHCI